MRSRFTSSLLLLLFGICFCKAQSYFATGSKILYKIDINDSGCGCSFDYIAPIVNYPFGLSFCPDTILTEVGTPDLWQIDTVTGGETQIFDMPPDIFPYFVGLLCVGNGIFYSMTKANDELYRYNVTNGTLTLVGSTGFVAIGDLTLFDGNIYYSAIGGIVQLDTNNLSNSSMVVSLPNNYIVLGLTASHFCNSLLAIGGYPGNQSTIELTLINLIDGAMTHLCFLPENIWHISMITSMLEFGINPPCNISLDLDCDNSSGAINSDYDSPDFNCLLNGVQVADDDVRMFYDDFISSMTIQITGFVPDAPFEILNSVGSIAGVNVSGAGTDLITLTNAGGAKSTDFIDALHFIRYMNTAAPLTPGPRTVEVQFTTASGSMSNIATAFIDVISLPYVDVDLGPDLQKCDGQTATFNAGNPGAAYVWNTGSHSQSITTGNSGQYIVTVSNGIQCPNQDTVELDIIPVIHVSLTGGTEICDNEHANMMITTDSPFPLDVEITPDPGSSFILTDVQGTYPFFDLPSITTTYTITSVTPSQDACVTITNPTQVFYVYPTYVSNTSASICQGDSIWLGYYWENQAGTYQILFNSEYGCDSTVTFTIDVLPAVNISATSTTCLPAEAGVFITHIDNPNGCDTVLTTT
ncbi:MAG: hypothetical protein ABJC12_12620, partial [Saprospiraceae bacterium]